MLLNEKGVPLDYTAKDTKMTCGRWKQCWGADDRRLQLHALDSLGEDHRFDLLKDYFGEICISEEVCSEEDEGFIAVVPELPATRPPVRLKKRL